LNVLLAARLTVILFSGLLIRMPSLFFYSLYIVRLFASARNKQTKRLRFWNALHAAAQPTTDTLPSKYLLNPYCFNCPTAHRN